MNGQDEERSTSQPQHTDSQADDRYKALCAGSDSIAQLMLIECALSVVRDGGDDMRKRSADECHLIVSAAADLLNDNIDRLNRSFETLWMETA